MKYRVLLTILTSQSFSLQVNNFLHLPISTNFSKPIMKNSLLVLGMFCIVGMLSLPSISAQTPSLEVEQSTYEKLVGQSIITKFSGYIDETAKGARVLLTITTPDGLEIENRVYPSSNGYFELFQSLDKNAEIGVYTATATYHDEIIGNVSFDLIDDGNYFLTTQPQIKNDNNHIPEWIKNIFVWYGDDLISETELLSAIKFLVNDGIINLKN